MSNDDSRSERRRFQRILFDAPLTLALGGSEYSSRLVDISLKGALVARPPRWPDAAAGPVNLLVRLDGVDGGIGMEADLVHVGAERIGLRCRHIDMDSVTHLRRLVELNLGDPSLLERELEALI